MVNSTLDQILAILENPTRRRILQKLSRERHYPLQLSKELRVSQQAIMKHLRVLEEHELVKSRPEKSDAGGPERKCYVANHQFSVLIDMAPNLFNVEVRPLSKDKKFLKEYTEYDKKLQEIQSEKDPKKRLNEVSQFLQEIDEMIDELEAKRSHLMGLKDEAMEEAHTSVEKLSQDYDERRLIYYMLDEADRTLAIMSERLNLREKVIREMLRNLKDGEILVDGGG